MKICIRFTSEVFHCWPDAPTHRHYLKTVHRHLMHVQVSMQVNHSDREVEFHDFLDFCKASFPVGDVGFLSCEQMGLQLLDTIKFVYGDRPTEVSVFEDGEVGAIVSNER